MKFNGAIVSKPLKDELEKALVPLEEKIEETADNAMEYRGAWTLNMKCHTNDVVTFGTELFIALKDSDGKVYPSQDTKSWKKIGITQQKSLQRGSNNIFLTDVNNYEPSQYPEAVFEVSLESQNIMLRMVRKVEVGGELEITLSSPLMTNASSAIIYSIHVQSKAETVKAYKATLTASGINTTEISAPTNANVYFDFT